MKEKKIGFFDQLFYAVAKPMEYKKLTELKPWRHVLYLAILMILCTMISFGIPLAGYISSVGGFENLFTNRLPAFSIENGEFTIAEPLDFEFQGVHIVADSDVNEYTKDIFKEDDFSSFYISKSNIMMSSGNYYMSYTFDEFDKAYKEAGLTFTMDNQELVRMIPLIYVWIGVMFILTLLGATIGYLLMGLLFAAFGQAFNMMIDTRLNFGKIFVIALYAETAMTIINKISSFFVGSMISFIIWMIMAFLTSRMVNLGIAAHKESPIGE